MIKDLMLLDKKRIEFKDGQVKIKHLFVDENQKAFTGWSDEGEELSDDLISSSDKFSKERARAFNVELDEYDGKMRSRVDLTLQRSTDT